MFFLKMNSPGVEVRPIKQANGQSGFNEVYFTDVPHSRRATVGGCRAGLARLPHHADERAPVHRLWHADRISGTVRLLHGGLRSTAMQPSTTLWCDPASPVSPFEPAV